MWPAQAAAHPVLHPLADLGIFLGPILLVVGVSIFIMGRQSRNSEERYK